MPARSLLVVAGHDPGALNHTRPLAELWAAAEEPVALGQAGTCDAVVVVPLRPSEPDVRWQPDMALDVVRRVEAEHEGQIRAALLGISTNQAEVDVLKAIKSTRPDAVVVMLVDFFIGHRLDTAEPPRMFPDLTLTTNPEAREELVTRYSGVVEADRFVCCGSTYLESLATDTAPPPLDAAQVAQRMGLADASSLRRTVPFFVSPDDMVPGSTDGVASALAEVARGVAAASANLASAGPLRVVLRPHPRNEPATKEMLAALCTPESPFSLDVNSGVDNRSLASCVPVTLSMGSTLGVESMAWGTPSAFYRGGWDPSRIDKIMGRLPVPRLSSPDGLAAFLTEHVSASGRRPSARGCSGGFDVEHCLGALLRADSAFRAALA